jgi:integrase
MTSPSKAFEFLILTCARASEVIGENKGKLPASWSEIDFDAKIWTVPKNRMKKRREHRVPLSSRAIDILKEMRRKQIEGCDFIFPGSKADFRMGDDALRNVRTELKRPVTVHGFRASFGTWAEEETHIRFPRDIIRAALAHRIKNDTDDAYQRGDLLMKRRKLMDAWAAYCARPGVDAGVKVVPMRTRKVR